MIFQQCLTNVSSLDICLANHTRALAKGSKFEGLEIDPKVPQIGTYIRSNIWKLNAETISG